MSWFNSVSRFKDLTFWWRSVSPPPPPPTLVYSAFPADYVGYVYIYIYTYLTASWTAVRE